MIPLYKQHREDIAKIDDFIKNYKQGKTKEVIATSKYLRLFTFEMSLGWKTANIIFYYGDSQAGGNSGICSINFRKYNAEQNIDTASFKTLSFNGNLANKLYAVITGINKIELYVKTQSSESPTLNILAINKFNSQDVSGKLTIDCETVVDVLPTGTQETPTSLL